MKVRLKDCQKLACDIIDELNDKELLTLYAASFNAAYGPIADRIKTFVDEQLRAQAALFVEVAKKCGE